MSTRNVDAQRWCEAIGSLVADALVDGGLVGKTEMEQAGRIIAEELFARLTVQDYPPLVDFTTLGE